MQDKKEPLIGLFPSLLPHRIGGIETSGRIARSVLLQYADERSCRLIYYGPGDTPDVLSPMETFVASKPEAIYRALLGRWAAGTVLVWNLRLLRLMPFLRLSSAKTVVFLHGVEAWCRHDPWTRRLLRKTSLFLSNTDYTWNRFTEYYPELYGAPHKTVYLGVGTPVEGSMTDPDDPPAALMLSRLHPGDDYKGHREMIKCWPLVLHRMPNAQLRIAGDGGLRPELEALVVSNKLENHVHFLGAVSEAQKEMLLAQCRFLALPSRGEGFGLVYTEAMRMGRPCLVSSCDAGREAVHPPEAGLAADPADLQALADAAVRLLTPGEEWLNWSHLAAERYGRCFTEDQFRKRFLAALVDSENQR